MMNSLTAKRWVVLCAAAVLGLAAAIQAANKAPAKPDKAAPAKKADKAPAKPKAHKAPAKKPAPAKPKAEKKAELPNIAQIALKGMVLSSPPEFSLFAGETQGSTLRDWLQRLAKARNDENIQAVALEIGAVGMSWAQAQELADAIRRLNAVKPVYAHITAGSATAYIVGSAGRELTMDPSGELMITGIATEMTFFRGTLDHIGVEPQLFQIGRYKGAAEPMMRTGPSPELKGEYNKLFDDLYNQLCGQIARQRHLTIPHVRYAVDNGPFDGPAALEYKLVDSLVERASWKQHVVNRVIGNREVSSIWHDNYAAKKSADVDLSNPFAVFGLLMGKKAKTATEDPTVAIIHADGVIIDGRSGSSLFGGKMVGDRTLASCFNEVADDDNVKAVIFRIDSPGGSALASEMIYQAVRNCAKKKPVIASVVGMGASGGYYIAVAADRIIADPSAIVGSIGVVGGKIATTGLMDKLGVSTYEVTRGRNAGLWSSRRWNEREQKLIKNMMENTYKKFTTRVCQGRGKKIKDITKVAQGRVFTARQAVGNGLIDEVGGLRESVMAAQKAAGISSSHILVLPRPKTLADLLSGGGIGAEAPAGLTGSDVATIRKLLSEAPGLFSAGHDRLQGFGYLLTLGQLLGKNCVLTAMPYHVSVKP